MFRTAQFTETTRLLNDAILTHYAQFHEMQGRRKTSFVTIVNSKIFRHLELFVPMSKYIFPIKNWFSEDAKLMLYIGMYKVQQVSCRYLRGFGYREYPRGTDSAPIGGAARVKPELSSNTNLHSQCHFQSFTRESIGELNSFTTAQLIYRERAVMNDKNFRRGWGRRKNVFFSKDILDTRRTTGTRRKIWT